MKKGQEVQKIPEWRVSIIGFDLIGKVRENGRVDCYVWGGSNLSMADVMENQRISNGSSTVVVINGEVKAPRFMVTVGRIENLEKTTP